MPLGRRYPAYLFDLDGTLVDTAPDIHAALNHALQHAGHPTVALPQVRDFVGMGSRALVQRALEHHERELDEHGREQIVAEFHTYYEANIAAYSRPFAGTLETLDALAERGARLAVVTNKYTHLTRAVLAALDLTRRFDTVVCGDATPQSKPAADPALVACNELAVAPADALFVGDAAPDVGCARAAGCPIVLRRDGYNNGVPAHELGADGVIESLTELLAAGSTA